MPAIFHKRHLSILYHNVALESVLNMDRTFSRRFLDVLCPVLLAHGYAQLPYHPTDLLTQCVLSVNTVNIFLILV